MSEAPRVAAAVADAELGSYQRAVRLLLVHPLITTTSPTADALPLVRRWSVQLAQDLDTVAGYRVELTPSCARLVRRMDRLEESPGLATATGRSFDRRRYAYLVLVLAVLGRSGIQVTITDLAARLRSMAGEIEGLGFDPDRHAHRTAFTDVLAQLEGWGGLRTVEGSSSAWQRDPTAGEALYDIDRDVCHLVFSPPRPLQRVRATEDLLEASLAAGRDALRAGTRQRLARALLEQPVVYLHDLAPTDRAYLRNEARPLTADLARLTGAAVERRAEGIALIDPGGFSDRRFPAAGTVAQAALLLADRINRAVAEPDELTSVRRPSSAEGSRGRLAVLDAALPAGARLELPAGRDEPAEHDGPEPEAPTADDPRLPLLAQAWVDTEVKAICAEHAPSLKESYVADPERLAREAVALLASFALVRRVPGGVVALPAITRYRDLTVTVAPLRQGSFDELLGATS